MAATRSKFGCGGCCYIIPDIPTGDDDFDLLDVRTICRRSTLGRSYIYEEIRAGRLRARKFGRLTRILLADYEAWLAAAPVTISATPPTPPTLKPPSTLINGGDGRPTKQAVPVDRPASSARN
jgi:excisionase family DNA binding protein